jgi:hypothetical protein
MEASAVSTEAPAATRLMWRKEDALDKFEFLSPGWIEMARRQIVLALQDKDLGSIQYTLCEEFTNPPEYLRRQGEGTAGFYVRIANGLVEVGDHPIDDADLKVVSDYTDALEVARDPGAPAADPKVVQERIAAGRVRIIGDPSSLPSALAEADIHRLLAPFTA